MSIVVTQSNYVPWRGWFATARSSDTLVFLDDVQYTRRDWRNRNIIAGKSGPRWITVPVNSKGHYELKIHEVRCNSRNWCRSHLSILDSTYSDFVHYKELRPDLQSIFGKAQTLSTLSDVNHLFTNWLFQILEIHTEVHDSRTLPSTKIRSERLVEICVAYGAERYITGPSARMYLDENLFKENSIVVDWVDYQKLPPLPSSEFDHQELSILHLLAVFGRTETIRLSTFSETTDTNNLIREVNSSDSI